MKRQFYIPMLIAVLVLFSDCGYHYESKARPIAKDGVLDLRGWDFEKDGPVKLTGEWEFYWNQLLKPEGFAFDGPVVKTGLFQVPGFWNDYQVGGEKLAGNGYATYRLRIKLDGGREFLAFRSADMSSAYSLYVNGKLLSSNGRVGRNRDDMIPQFLPRLVSFQKSSEELDILLQISNFHHYRGGPWAPIQLGAKERLVRAQARDNALNLFIVGGLVIMGLYHLGIFFMRSKDRAPFFFGLFCLVIALRSLVTGERFLVSIFPHLPWEFYIKLEYLSLYVSLPIFGTFVNTFFGRAFNRIFMFLLWGLILFLLGIVLLTPAILHTYTLRLFQSMAIIFILYLFYVVVTALLQKREGAPIFLLGAFALGATAINDILFNNQLIQTAYLFPVGLFLFIFLQAYSLSMRFSGAFVAVERLTGEMESLRKLSRRVNEAGDLTSVLSQVQSALREQLGPLTVWLLLVDDGRNELYGESFRPTPGRSMTEKQKRTIKNFRVALKPEAGSLYRTFKSRRALLVNRLEELADNKPEMDVIRSLGIESFVQLPLIVQNEVIGILAIGGIAGIHEKHMAWLKLFADQAAGTVHSANLLARAEEARAEIQELNEFSKKLNATTVLKENLDYICAFVQQNYNVDRILILRTDLEKDALIHLYDLVPGPVHGAAEALAIPLTEEGGLVYRTFRRKKPFFVSHEMVARGLFRKPYKGIDFDRNLVDSLWLNSFMLVPLIVQEEVIGIGMFSFYGADSSVSRGHMPAITRFCEQIAGSLYTSSLLEIVREKRQAADRARADAELSRAVAEAAALEVEQLNRLSRRINETVDVEAILDEVFAYLENTFQIDGSVVVLHDPAPDELYVLKFSAPFMDSASTEEMEEIMRFPLQAECGSLYSTFFRRKSFYLKNAQSLLGRNLAVGKDKTILEIWNINDLLQIPLVIQNQSIGIICLTRLGEPMYLTKEEIRSIERTCGQIAGAIYISSLFKQVELQTRELGLANQKLQEADRAKTQFFANLSHEFRTPLTLILAPTESIMKGDFGERVSRNNGIFKSILENGFRLLRLINHLLDFTKIEADRMNLRKQKTDMPALLDFYKSSVLPGADSRGLELDFQDNTEGLFAYIDRDLMEKAIMNLLSNALKFTRSGGRILIRLDRQGDDDFTISVQDNGVGVPEDKQDSIFERFSQVDESSSRKYEGTGIGLSLTKEIVELHGGEISLQSRHGQGSVFTVSIPIGASEEAIDGDLEDLEAIGEIKTYLMANLPGQGPDESPLEIKSDSETNPRHDYSILLVEDNADMRSFLKMLLERDYNVNIAENGRLGLERAMESKPDLILSDVMMPEMDGYQMTRELKQDAATRDIPVILLSAKSDVSYRIEGLEFGADDYVSKPFNSGELLARIHNHIEGRKLERELKQEKKERDKDFLQAARVQKTILTPRSFMNQFEELEVGFTYLPMNGQVSGDYYNVSPLEQGIASFFLADATGHGTQAALSTMQIDLLYRETLSKKYPDERFEQINNKFVLELQSKNFFTGAIIDILPDRIRYSTAGHPEQFLIKRDKPDIQLLRTGGGMIGMQKNRNYEMKESDFSKGDILLLFSDGIFEVFNDDNEEFGEDRFTELVQAGIRQGLFKEPIDKIIESILGDLDLFRNGHPFRDDITVFGVRLK